MDLLSQEPIFSSDPATKDFEILAGNRWIYPENLPIREYQFTITRTALFHNTLVCLPTGLGKTFIAAVVMYNYWRWYPKGIIVFLAPTKPLVAQQIDACHDLMGIPISDTIELTGQINPKLREAVWRKKRVIFATPQTFQKDLERGIIPTQLIKCVVIDEAHKALGKHSYCESIRILNESNQYFRVLALSATPGAKLEAVQEVIRNLLITRLELRDDSSSDITPYINERKMDTILVNLGDDLIRFKEKYIAIMDRHVKVLINNNVIRGTTASLSKGLIFHLKKQFGAQPQKHRNHGVVMKTLTVLLTMYHAYELIIRHGLRAFYNFYNKSLDKFWLKNEVELGELLGEICEFIGPFPDVAGLMDGSVTDIPNNIVFGHGKFHKLQELLLTHFHDAENKGESTRAIVFVEYRDIVNEVYVLLLQSRPLVRPQVFVGQAGLKQKAQKKALEDFRNNIVNVLISTSVGEEGLDVGEVDLIICFDISQVSPTRLVQRMGRTGRKRDGHIIVLVTDGKEHQTLKSALSKRDSLNSKVMASSAVVQALHTKSPRMIPEGINPECLKMNITVIPKAPGTKGKRKKTKTTVEQAISIMDDETTKDTAGKADLDDQIMKKNTEKTSITEGKGKKTANLKTKNQKSLKNDAPKRAGQSTLMKFFANPSQIPLEEEDHNIVDMRTEVIKLDPIRSQFVKTGNTIKPTMVKLLVLDNAALEFLTLCTLKNSEKDLIENRNLEIPHMPQCKFGKEENDFFNNFEIPSYKILDCIKSLSEYIKPVEESQRLPEIDFEDDIWKFSQPGCSQFPRQLSKSPDDLEEAKWRFEDILDESDSDATFYDADANSPPAECVDWSNGDFEDEPSKEIDENPAVVINEISTESEPVIEGGGFEDLLNDSSDEEIEGTPPMLLSLEKTSLKSKSKEFLNNSKEKSMRMCINSSSESIPVVGGGFEDILDDSTDESRDYIGENSAMNSRANLKSQAPNPEVETVDIALVEISDDDDDVTLLEENKSKPGKIAETEKASNEEPMEINVFVQNKLIDKSVPIIAQNITLPEQKINDGSGGKTVKNLAEVDTLEMGSDDFFMEHEITDESTPTKFDKKRTLRTLKQRANGELVPDQFALNKSSEAPVINSLPRKNGMNSIDEIEASFPSWNRAKSVDSNSKKDSERKMSQDKLAKEVMMDSVNCSTEFAFSEKYEPITSRIKKPQKSTDIPQRSSQSKKSSNDSGGYSYPQTVDVNLIDNLEDNFSSWESIDGRKSKESNSNGLIKSLRKIPSREFSRIPSVSNIQVNSMTNPKRSSQGKSTEKSNGSKVNSEPIIELAETAVNDSFFDSDFEEEVSMENPKPRKGDSNNVVLLSKNQKKNPLENSDNLGEEKSALVTHRSAGVENPGMTNTNADDFEWDSDFETFSDPLIQSKYFQKSEPSIKPLKLSLASRPNLESRKEIPQQEVGNTAESVRLERIRAAIQPKRGPIHQTNNDSDDDFMSSKIVFSGRPSNFVNIVKDSDAPTFSGNGTKNSSSKAQALSIQDLKKFTAPKKYQPKQEKAKEQTARSDYRKKKTQERRARKKGNHFIDDEAEVSSDENHSLGSSEDGDEDDDEDLGDFVSYSQHHEEDVDMKALYLQSVKSPSQPGRFHIRKPKTPPPDLQIYSQAVPEEDTYVYDSFCVQEGDESYNAEEISADELSDDGNSKRKSKKNNKKRKRDDSTESRSKRKRIVVISDSSEDDTEKLRAAIEKESKRLNHF